GLGPSTLPGLGGGRRVRSHETKCSADFLPCPLIGQLPAIVRAHAGTSFGRAEAARHAGLGRCARGIGAGRRSGDASENAEEGNVPAPAWVVVAGGARTWAHVRICSRKAAVGRDEAGG